MAEKQGRTTIEVVAGRKTSGDRVFEEVLVDDLGNDRYRIVATPGLRPQRRRRKRGGLRRVETHGVRGGTRP
jgi:hypothetical protein